MFTSSQFKDDVNFWVVFSVLNLFFFIIGGHFVLSGPEVNTEENHVEDPSASDNERSFLFGPRSATTSINVPLQAILAVSSLVFLQGCRN